MKYCKKCLEPSTRPNNTFNKQGICKVCEYYDSLKEVNWEERLEILNDLVPFHDNERVIEKPKPTPKL